MHGRTHIEAIKEGLAWTTHKRLQLFKTVIPLDAKE